MNVLATAECLSACGAPSQVALCTGRAMFIATKFTLCNAFLSVADAAHAGAYAAPLVIVVLIHFVAVFLLVVVVAS